MKPRKNVRIDFTITADTGADCDAVMSHLLGALPPEATAQVIQRSTEPADVSTMGGPSQIVVTQVETTYTVSMDTMAVLAESGPRIIQL